MRILVKCVTVWRGTKTSECLFSKNKTIFNTKRKKKKKASTWPFLDKI